VVGISAVWFSLGKAIPGLEGDAVKREVSSSLGFFLVLVLISICLFVIDSLGWVRAIRRGIENVLVPVEKAVYSASRLVGVPLEMVRFSRSGMARITDLERQLAQLSVDTVRVYELEKENEAMRKLLGVSLPPQWSYVPAAVIGKGEKLALGVGEIHGLRGGEAVVWQDIFLGTVASVSKRQSVVRLLVDPESRVSTFVPRSGIDGLLVGRFGSQMVFSQVLQAGDLREGDLVATLGESGIPRGLLVGKVGKILSDETDVYKEALVEPIVDIGKLDTVFVLKE